MRTTVTIDDGLLAEAKLLAARQHRTIGSVFEDALRALLAERDSTASGGAFELPRFGSGNPGARAGVDVRDKEQLADLLGDNELPRGM